MACTVDKDTVVQYLQLWVTGGGWRNKFTRDRSISQSVSRSVGSAYGGKQGKSYDVLQPVTVEDAKIINKKSIK